MNKEDTVKAIQREIRHWDHELHLAKKDPVANVSSIPFYIGMKQGLKSALNYLKVME